MSSEISSWVIFGNAILVKFGGEKAIRFYRNCEIENSTYRDVAGFVGVSLCATGISGRGLYYKGNYLAEEPWCFRR